MTDTALREGLVYSQLEVYVAVPVLGENLIILLAWEGRFLQGQHVKDDSDAE
jgi:hypothetical protein